MIKKKENILVTTTIVLIMVPSMTGMKPNNVGTL